MNSKRQAANRINRTAPAWTDEDIGALILMHQDGKSFGDIATVLGKTRNQVAGKCARLGLKLSPEERHKRFHDSGVRNRAKQLAAAQ